ncbi:MAG: leucine-rich repeat domain-containing protein, partial [Muribaculaceae bacterium]|nr:leucine-rich repeat domain-containing protein [Muribaculaceae bacterium]
FIQKLLTVMSMFMTIELVYAYDFEVDGIYYSFISLDDMTCEVVNGDIKYEGAIAIPTEVTYDTCVLSVTSIGDIAFYDCIGLTSVTIPNSVTSIGERTFRYCSNLTDIFVEDGNEYYASDKGVLYNRDKTVLIQCPGGKTECEISSTVASIGNSAFYDCHRLTSVTIPNSVTIIGKYAFKDCYNLTSVIIPNSVTSIGDHAFDYCRRLTSVTIPNSVTSIGDYVFVVCDKLTDIFVEDGNEYYASDKGVLYNRDKTVLIQCPGGKTEYEIPTTVTSIGNSAFYYCRGLTSVTIPNSVTSIGEEAFYGCSSLISVTIPNSVTSIGEYAFRDCSSLTSVSIPNSVTSIGFGSFLECTALKSVTIPNSMTSISACTFQGCKTLESVTIPSSVTVIENDAFSGCALLKSVTIPNSVKEISNAAFSNCTSLKSMTIPSSVKYIATATFNNCSSLESVTIPNSVTFIGSFAFKGCSSLKSLTIPNSVTNIRNSAFSYCDSLKTIKLSDNLTSIECGLFEGCSSLLSLEIPRSIAYINQFYEELNSIYYYTYDNCKELTKFRLLYSDKKLFVGYQIWNNKYLQSAPWYDWTESIKELYIDRSLSESISVPNLEKLVIGEHMNDVQVNNIDELEKLTTIESQALVPPDLSKMTNAQYMNINVYVPEEALEAYKADENWGKFWNLKASGVESVIEVLPKTIIGRYDLSGNTVNEYYKGLVIVRFSDGSIKKILQ